MLSIGSRGTVMSYTDHSVPHLLKSYTPNIFVGLRLHLCTACNIPETENLKWHHMTPLSSEQESKGRLPHAHRLTNRAARVRIHFGRCNASSSKDVFEETHPERLGSIKHCLGETHLITHSTQLTRTGEGYSLHH